MPPPDRPRVMFLNRSYWPDAEATGQLLTELCEDLAKEFEVSVLCGQPNQNLQDESYLTSGRETHRNVEIERVRNTRFGKRRLIGKLMNFLSFLGSAWLRSFRIRKPQIVVCETDPFLLPILAVWISFWKRSRLIFYLQDIYPEIAVAVGKARPGLVVSMTRRLLRWCYRRADAIVVLSDDMKQTLLAWGTLKEPTIRVIPNWVDTRQIKPIKTDNPWRLEHNLQNQFVVMYSGNIGLSQELHIVVAAAAILSKRENLTILLIGDGAKRVELEELSKEIGVKNLHFLPYQPRERLAESLSAADLHLLPVQAEALRCLMPSKLYGILASQTALISTAPPETELAHIVNQNEIGHNIFPCSPEQLATAIADLHENPTRLSEMSMRGRRLAETEFDRTASVSAFRELLKSLSNSSSSDGESTSGSQIS